jgi:uncharacterized surface protein with fasciclin (FAS1) repeats
MKTQTLQILKKVLFLGIVLSLSSCKDQAPEFIDLSKTLDKDARFTTFNKLLKDNGFGDVLQNPKLTILAPTNDAFVDVNINALSKAEIKDILNRHIVERDLDGEKFMAGGVKTLGTDVYFSKLWDDGFAINGSVKVIKPLIFANNGAIFPVNKIINSSNKNTMEIIQADEKLTEFVSLVALADPKVVATLTNLSKLGITAFIPTNAAFEALYQTKSKAELVKNKEALTNLLMGHLLERRIFTSDFATNWGAFPAINSTNKISFSASGNFQLKGNASNSNLVRSNGLATNGVVHTIDAVLLP